jgi:hypothetical protein
MDNCVLSYDPVTGRGTTLEVDAATGVLIIKKTQPTRAIVESAKRLAANFSGTNRQGVTHVARIPKVVWQRLVQVGIAQDEKAMNAWLNDRDNRVFRTDDSRRL